jgi:hypothetical protein
MVHGVHFSLTLLALASVAAQSVTSPWDGTGAIGQGFPTALGSFSFYTSVNYNQYFAGNISARQLFLTGVLGASLQGPHSFC